MLAIFNEDGSWSWPGTLQVVAWKGCGNAGGGGNYEGGGGGGGGSGWALNIAGNIAGTFFAHGLIYRGAEDTLDISGISQTAQGENGIGEMISATIFTAVPATKMGCGKSGNASGRTGTA